MLEHISRKHPDYVNSAATGGQLDDPPVKSNLPEPTQDLTFVPPAIPLASDELNPDPEEDAACQGMMVELARLRRERISVHYELQRQDLRIEHLETALRDRQEYLILWGHRSSFS